jgi:hypothetical protein
VVHELQIGRAIGGLDRRMKQIEQSLAQYLSTNRVPKDVGDITRLERKVRALAYHIRATDEVQNMVAVRPERAVPALVQDAKGMTWINPVKEVTKPFTLAATPRGLVTIPAGKSVTVTFLAPTEENNRGDFEITELMLTRYTSACFKVELLHGGRNMNLQNQPVHQAGVFGDMTASTGFQPFALFESIFLEPGQELQVKFTDFSGSDNMVEVFASGRRFLGYDVGGLDREGLINLFYSRRSVPFWQTFDTVASMGSGSTGQATPTSTIDRSYDLEVGRIVYQTSTVTGGTGVASAIRSHVQVNEGRTGRLIFDNVHSLAFGGNGNFPNNLMEPWLIKRGTVLAFTFTNDITGTANQQVDVVMHGRALPYRVPGRRSLAPASRGQNVQAPLGQQDLSVSRALSL